MTEREKRIEEFCATFVRRWYNIMNAQTITSSNVQAVARATAETLDEMGVLTPPKLAIDINKLKFD